MQLTLVCYYPAEDPCFMTIDITNDPHTCVDRLRLAIHQRLLISIGKSSGVPDVLKDLFLYQTDVEINPLGSLPQRALRWLHGRRDEDRLQDGNLLSSLLPDDTYTPAGQVHIMVADATVLERTDTLGYANVQFNRKVEKDVSESIATLSIGPSPSAVVADPAKVADFLSGPNIKAYLDQVPVAIFSPPLAKLQRNLDDLDSVEYSYSDIDHAASLLRNAVRFFKNEGDRGSWIKADIEGLVGKPGQWDERLDWAAGIKPDASWWHGNFPLMLLELKNTKGLGGDPVLQAVCDYSKILPTEKLRAFQFNSNFPVILVGIAGPRIEVSVAVAMKSIFASKLYTLDLSSGCQSAKTILRLARVFNALSLCSSELDTYYTGIRRSKDPTLSYMFPSPTLASNTPLPLPSLTYRRFMARSGQPTSTVPDLGNMATFMYFATLNDTGKEVVVKFTSCYNKEAHVIAADAHLAPQLYFCERVIGDMYMVVMEYVKGKSIWQLVQEKAVIPAIVLGKVDEAISLLHERNIVFGDLRDANVLYAPPDGLAEDRVCLTDFDWAGIDGEGKYPATLNSKNGWHLSVRPGGPMLKEHDIYQLQRLKELCSRKA